MNDIKLHIGCLGIILYLIVMYVKETLRKDISCNSFYDALLIVSPWAVLFDGITAITVNHLDTVPLLANKLLHMMFYLLMYAMIIITSLYMYDKTIGFKKGKVGVLTMTFPGIISAIVMMAFIPNLRFIEGGITNYSFGVSVYLCFVTVAAYYGYILFLIFSRQKSIPKDKRIGTESFVILVGILLIIQLVFPQMLLTAMCTTVMVLGIYIVFENPSIRKVENNNEMMVDSFAALVENRDNNTGGHIKRTKLYVQMMIDKMKVNPKYKDIMTRDYIAYVTEAAPLHDIGKISTPDYILQKEGKLTNDEYEIMKKHAACGGDIILNTFRDMYSAEAKKIVCEVARHHHEKYNGKGYPDGLSGEEIPLHARIMAIADVFDAVSQNRCYRAAMPLDKCFRIIEEGSGTDFDPDLVKIFLDARDEVTALCEEYRDKDASSSS